MIGQKFGKLLAVADSGLRKHGKAVFDCVCDCGNKTQVISSALRSGHSKSCGCARYKSPPLADRFWSKVNRLGYDECWEWKSSAKCRGYGVFAVDRKPHRSNRVAWELTFGPIPDGMHVLHRCDNPACCNPNHLFLGTNRDNSDDKIAKKRQNFGERHGIAKLTDSKVRYIRLLRPPGKPPRGLQAAIARQLKVSSSTINLIWKGATWKHVDA